MASAVSAIAGGAGASTSSSSALGGAEPSEQVFLQLLVAQLQNQDPLNPEDSTQFVAELAQFSELEQVIGIRQDIESYMASDASATGAANNTQSATDASDAGQTTTAANSTSS